MKLAHRIVLASTSKMPGVLMCPEKPLRGGGFKIPLVEAVSKDELKDQAIPSLADCSAHLQLLTMLVEHQAAVRMRARDMQTQPDEFWSQYVELAAMRFVLWFGSATAHTLRTTVPPIGRCDR
jgi:predicted CoA-binding protein